METPRFLYAGFYCMWLLWLNITQRTFAFIELVWEFNFRCKYTNIKYACANKLFSSLHSSCNKVTSKIVVSVILGGLGCNLGAIFVQFRPFCGLRKFSPKVFIQPSLFFPASTKTTFPNSKIQFNPSLNNVNHLLYLTSTQAVTALQCAPERLALLSLTLRFGVTSTTGAA